MNKRVRFNPYINIRFIGKNKEERKSDWINVAADRHRFERRIKETHIILKPILLQKQLDQISGRFADIKLE